MPAHHITKRKKITLKWPLAILLASTMTTSFAVSDSAELTVVGTITPAACQLDLSNGGLVNYNTISGSLIRQNSFYVPNVGTFRSLTLTVTCTAAKKVRIKVTDNKPNTYAPGGLAEIHAGWPDTLAFGLGLTPAGKKIGAYSVALEQTTFTVTDSTGRSISNARTILFDGSQWTDNSTGAVPPGTWASWGDTGLGLSPTPLVITKATGNLLVKTAINNATELSLKDAVNLQGSATLQLEYL